VKAICKGEREEEKFVEIERKKYNLTKKESTSKEKRKIKTCPTKESTLVPPPPPPELTQSECPPSSTLSYSFLSLCGRYTVAYSI
jgi:hypothetical protein